MPYPHQGLKWLSVLIVLSVVPLASARAADVELVQTIDLKGKPGAMDHLALDVKRDRLLLANKCNNSLDVIDLKAGKIVKQIANQQGVQGVAYSPDVDKIFVGLGIKGFCNIFDGESLKLVESIKFEDDADNVRYNPTLKSVYVGHADKSLGVVDAKSMELKTDIKLPGTAEGFEVEKARPRLYVNIPDAALVAVIDTEKNEVIAKYPVKMAGGFHPLALDEANHRMFVGCRKAPMVIVMDTETGKEITSIPVPGDIDDLVYDAKRKKLYATCGEGFIAVIKQLGADSYEAGEKVATAKGAKTSHYNPEQSRLYVAVPRQEGKDGPEIRVYQIK